MRLNHFFYTLVVILLILCGLIIRYALPEGTEVFYLAEGAVALALVFLILFYGRVVRPIRSIAEGLDLLRGQDFSTRLRKVGQYEADKIIDVFNPMMEQLKEERLKVREQNQFLDLLIDASPMGLVAIDTAGRVVQTNPASCRMLGRNPVGMKLSEIDHPIARQLCRLAVNESAVLRLSSSDIYRCQRLAFVSHGYAHPFFLIEVLTNEVRAAEKSAYEKAIRMIVHEVNNTMGGVDATLHALEDSFGPESAEGDVIDTCLRRTSKLGGFITRFAAAAKIPRPVCVPGDVNELVEANSNFLESLCSASGVGFAVEAGSARDFPASFDSALMEQVLVNVVKNSVESIVASSRPDGKVVIAIDPDKRTLSITDNGPGISPETSRQLFTPFFTTKPGGQGIGMILISDILKSHGFRFSLTTSDTDSLTRFIIGF